MKKVSLQKVLQLIAIMIFIIGAFIGYDAGNKMLTIDSQIVYTFGL